MLARLSTAEAKARVAEQARDRSETEAAGRLRALAAAHEAEVTELEARLAELSDAAAGGSSIRTAAGGGWGGRAVPLGGLLGASGAQQVLPPGAASELRLRVRSLEALNRQLEEELDSARGREREALAEVEGLREAAVMSEVEERFSAAAARRAQSHPSAKSDHETAMDRYGSGFGSRSGYCLILSSVPVPSSSTNKCVLPLKLDPVPQAEARPDLQG